jgi:hypothetical protein
MRSWIHPQSDPIEFSLDKDIALFYILSACVYHEAFLLLQAPLGPASRQGRQTAYSSGNSPCNDKMVRTDSEQPERLEEQFSQYVPVALDSAHEIDVGA